VASIATEACYFAPSAALSSSGAGRRIRSVRAFCQPGLGVFFFVEGLLQDGHMAGWAELPSPVTSAAVKSDLVVLDFLGGGDESGITRRASFRFFHDVFAYPRFALHSFLPLSFTRWLRLAAERQRAAPSRPPVCSGDMAAPRCTPAIYRIARGVPTHHRRNRVSPTPLSFLPLRWVGHS
jgi:hypothetical protein